MRKMRLASVVAPVIASMLLVPGLTSAALDPGLTSVPQGTQSDTAYAASFQANHVTNTFATASAVSCYRPEAPYLVNNGPNDGYSGESVCPGANTGENIGTTPYATQQGSNPGYPAPGPDLVKDHSESDLRVDPTNPLHLIGSSKWIVSPEGYNHLLGFYESFDGGRTWPTQGHIPGYEGWTDNTDPVGAFDGFGNYYELILPYEFFYKADGSHDFTVGGSQEPNPAVPAEVIAVSVRPRGSTLATDWLSTHAGHPDIVASYDAKGNEPDKQWITIDTNPSSPNYNTIYAMWVDFNGPFGSKPFVSTAKALSDGTHTDWSIPLLLPTLNGTAADTYLLPHVDPAGVVWTPVANFPSKAQRCCANLSVDFSTDGGLTWQGPLTVAQSIIQPSLIYANTTFRFGILETFAVGSRRSAQGHYPLYVAWEEASAGVSNILLVVSNDGGHTWSTPIRVNDNQSTVDELQPNLTAADSGTISVAFYDRRLACPTGGVEATGAGIALDTANPNYTGSLPPYGAANYCVNSSVQFYTATLGPIGHNIRLSQHTWDPQLNAPHPSNAFNNGYTFIGDYFGNVIANSTNYSSSVSTFNDGSNPSHQQQQVIAVVSAP